MGRLEPERMTLGVSFLLFYCYSVAAALLFQKLLLPALANNPAGVLEGDAIYFHNVAVELAERIKANGWSEWSLFPTIGSGGNVGILAALYVFVRPDISAIVPINAAVHALSGCLLLSMGRLLWPGRGGSIAGLLAGIAFTIFPSALNWYGQAHKDGFAIAGSLLVLLAWLRTTLRSPTKPEILRSLGLTACGIALILLVRQYQLRLMVLVFAAIFALWLVRSLSRGETRNIATASRSVILLVIMGMMVFASSSFNAGATALNDIEKRTPAAAGLTHAAWTWQPTAWLPASIDARLEVIMRARAQLINYGVVEGAQSTIDAEIVPDSAAVVVAYLPRALSIALFAPFPNTWLEKLSAARLVAIGEMTIWYLIAPGVIIALWKRKEFWPVTLFSLAMLALLGLTVANVGSLYRVRYLYLMLLMLVGLAGWATVLLRWLPSRPSRPPDAGLEREVEFRSDIRHRRSGMIRSGLAVGGSMLLTFALLLLRDVLMARGFGLGTEMDAFSLATTIPMFLATALCVPIGAAVVPAFLAARQKGAETALIESLASTYAICASLICASIALGGILLLGLQLVGGPAVSELAWPMLCIMVVILLLGGYVALANGILNALGHSSVSALAQMAVPIAALVVLMTLGTAWGAFAAIAGMLLGQVVNLAIVVYALRTHGIVLAHGWRRSFSIPEGFANQYITLAVAAIFANLMVPVSMVMASSLPEGGLSALNLGIKFTTILTGLIGSALAAVVLPYFSRITLEISREHARRELSHLCLWGAILSMPVSLALYALIPTGIEHLFFGGKFGASDVALVTRIAQFGCLQLPFFVINLLQLKYSVATQNARRVLAVSLLSTGLVVGLSAELVPHFGVSGIALAMTLSVAASSAVLIMISWMKSEIELTDLFRITIALELYLVAAICLHFGSWSGLISSAVALVALVIPDIRSILRNNLMSLAPARYSA